MPALEKALREVLASIALGLKQYPPPLDVIANEVLREVRKEFVKLALGQQYSEHLATLLDDLLSPEYRKGIASAYCYLVNEIGLDRDKAVALVIEAIKVTAGLQERRHLPPVHRTIIDYIVEIIEGEETYSSCPLSLLDYASELGLVYWDGEKWNITELGKFMIKLPPLELVKALLTLEILLPATSLNSMSKEFLQLLKGLFSKSNIHRTEYIVAVSGTHGSLVYSWLLRLSGLGLISTDHREGRIKANQFTIQLLEEVLDTNSNPYITILRSLLLPQLASSIVKADTPSYIM